MASASFSSTLGGAEAGTDQRSSLIAALRSRLGNCDEDAEDVNAEAPDFNSDGLSLVPPKEEGPEDSIAYLSDFLFAHAEESVDTGDDMADAFTRMDRGMDARSKVLDALKVSISRSSALPKQQARPPVAAASVGAGQIIDLELDAPDELPSLPAVPAPDAPGVSFHQPPEVCSCGHVPKRTAKFCIQCGNPWKAADSAPGMAPPLKRLRPDPAGLAPSFPPAPPPPLISAPPPLIPAPQLPHAPPLTPAPLIMPPPAPQPEPIVQPAPPSAPSQPAGPALNSAEAAELAARKAAMLGRLQAAETLGQPGLEAPRPPSAPVPSKAGLPNPGSSSTSPAPADAPAGSSPEQFEAYRRQCWQQYYEYCTVWKKYYTQNQAEQSGKGKAKGKLRPPGGVPSDLLQNPAMALAPSGMSMPAGMGIGGLGAPPPARVVPPPGLGGPLGATGARPGGLPAALSGTLAVAAANQLAATKARPAEEDIHSKLLGL